MNSDQTPFDFILKYVLPMGALFASLLAYFNSRKALKHTEKVSEPMIIKREYLPTRYSFIIKDYSVGRIYELMGCILNL